MEDKEDRIPSTFEKDGIVFKVLHIRTKRRTPSESKRTIQKRNIQFIKS